MAIDKLASDKLRLISFFAMCAVVSWHISDDGGFLKRWVCPVANVWSVPWFFFVSGVFFVYSIQKSTWIQFAIGKIRSLLIPYVAWCLIGFVVKSILDGGAVFDMRAVFALDRLHPIGNGPMWYIRALMIIFAMSVPLWVLLANVVKGLGLQLLFSGSLVVILCALQYIGVNLHLGPGSSVFYFLLGVVLSRYVVAFPMLPWFDEHKRRLFGLVLLMVAIGIRVGWFAMGYDYYKSGGTLVANLSVVIFIFAALILMDSEVVIDRVGRAFGRFAKYNTFVYMVHNIFLGVMISAALGLGLSPDIVYVSLSLAVPVLFVAVGALLKHKFPLAYAVLTGYR